MRSKSLLFQALGFNSVLSPQTALPKSMHYSSFHSVNLAFKNRPLVRIGPQSRSWSCDVEFRSSWDVLMVNPNLWGCNRTGPCSVMGQGCYSANAEWGSLPRDAERGGVPQGHGAGRSPPETLNLAGLIPPLTAMQVVSIHSQAPAGTFDAYQVCEK